MNFLKYIKFCDYNEFYFCEIQFMILDLIFGAVLSVAGVCCGITFLTVMGLVNIAFSALTCFFPEMPERIFYKINAIAKEAYAVCNFIINPFSLVLYAILYLDDKKRH